MNKKRGGLVATDDCLLFDANISLVPYFRLTLRHNMQHSLKYFIVILALIALLFGVGGKVNLCLTTDGDVHVESDYSSCELVRECPATADALVFSHDQVNSQSPCQDISLRGDASNSPHRSIVQLPIPALVSLGPSVVLAPPDPKPFFTISTVALPQFVLQQSVILLI